MKDKTKKIIAGIGLGAVLATSGMFMTGCSMNEADTAKMMGIAENADQFMADLKEDMDNLNTNIDQIQASLDDLNENSYRREDAKIMLVDYIYKALANNDYTSLERTYETVVFDTFGNKSTDVQNYKYYNNGEIIKEYENSQQGGDVYKESMLGESGYTSKIYDVTTKTFTQEENIESLSPLVQTISGTLNVLLSMVSDDIESEIESEDFSATIESDGSVSFEFKVKTPVDEQFNISFFELKFENGKLVQMTSVSRYASVGLGFIEVDNPYAVQTVTFKYNIDDFAFDATGYVEV